MKHVERVSSFLILIARIGPIAISEVAVADLLLSSPGRRILADCDRTASKGSGRQVHLQDLNIQDSVEGCPTKTCLSTSFSCSFFHSFNRVIIIVGRPD